MKRILALFLCATIFLISGCASNKNMSTSEHSTKFLKNYFSDDINDTTLEEFTASNDFENYITDNITSISVDGHEFTIQETKFSEMAEILKPYVKEETELSLINQANENFDNNKEMFYIRTTFSNSTSAIFRFKPKAENTSVGDFILYSFTVVHNVYIANSKDKLVNNLSCVVPLTITEDIWKSKISNKVRCDDSDITNVYYLYNSAQGFTTPNNVKIGAYSIQTTFNKECGYLVYLSYEVNS